MPELERQLRRHADYVEREYKPHFDGVQIRLAAAERPVERPVGRDRTGIPFLAGAAVLAAAVFAALLLYNREPQLNLPEPASGDSVPSVPIGEWRRIASIDVKVTGRRSDYHRAAIVADQKLILPAILVIPDADGWFDRVGESLLVNPSDGTTSYIAAPPVPMRADRSPAVWTGSELLFVDQPTSAAYHPDTGTWRTIATPPAIGSPIAAFVQGDRVITWSPEGGVGELEVTTSMWRLLGPAWPDGVEAPAPPGPRFPYPAQWTSTQTDLIVADDVGRRVYAFSLAEGRWSVLHDGPPVGTILTRGNSVVGLRDDRLQSVGLPAPYAWSVDLPTSGAGPRRVSQTVEVAGVLALLSGTDRPAESGPVELILDVSRGQIRRTPPLPGGDIALGMTARFGDVIVWASSGPYQPHELELWAYRVDPRVN
jgi:hypothetical protein